MLVPSVRAFFEYLKSFGRYFGKDELTFFGFISIYLNYDTDRNPLRKAILDCSGKPKEKMNIDCLKFIRESKEEIAIESRFYGKEFLGKDIIITKKLNDFLSELNVEKYSADNPDKPAQATIHDVMANMWYCNSVRIDLMSYFKKVFKVSYATINEGVQDNLSNLKHDDNCFEIPEEFRYCMTVVDGRREEYKLPAERYIKDLYWDSYFKEELTNVAFCAPAYSKTDNVIYNIAYEVEHKISCPSVKDVVLIELDVEKIYCEKAYDKDIIKAIKKITEFLLGLKNRRNMILYFKNFTSLVALGSEKCDDSYLFMLMPLFMDKYLRTIITLNEEEAKDCDYVRYPKKIFTFIVAGMPVKEEKALYLHGNTVKLAMAQGVNCTDCDIDTAMQFSKAMDFNTISGALDVLDIAMGYANRQGRCELNRGDYIEYFKIQFHEYEKNTDEYKTRIAYHEAGHFVLSRFSQYYKAIYSDLVSVIAVGEAGGLNALEYDATLMKDFGYNFYLEQIAGFLAGRASEELFCKDSGVSSGAESDLLYATQVATAMISQYGLDKENNFEIKGNENLRSEKSINEVADKVNVIISEAYNLAKQVLSEHSKYVRSLERLLLKEKIISRKAIMAMEVEKDGDVRLKA